MATVKPIFIDTRVLKNKVPPSNGTSLGNLDSLFDLQSYIDLVVNNTSFTNISLANGTVALPSLSFASDPDSGVYRIGANNIGVAVNATKILDISTGGLGLTGSLLLTGVILGGAGAVGAPEYSFTGQTDMGQYKVSSTQLGVAVSGALVGGWNASGLFTSTITEQVSGAGITFAKATIQKNTATAVNVTGSITAAQLAGGLITSTSAAAVTATLPTATLLATQLGAVQGTVFDFVVDNHSGANTVTMAVNTGITVGTAPVTGGDTLTVSTANSVAYFRLVFTSTTTAILRRIV